MERCSNEAFSSLYNSIGSSDEGECSSQAVPYCCAKWLGHWRLKTPSRLNVSRVAINYSNFLRYIYIYIKDVRQ